MYIHWFWLIMIMDYSLMDYNLMIYMYYTIWFTTYYINIVSYDYVLCHDIMYIHWLWYYMIWWLWIIDDYSLMDYNLMIMYCVMILCRLHTFRLYNTLYIYIYIYTRYTHDCIAVCEDRAVLRLRGPCSDDQRAGGPTRTRPDAPRKIDLLRWWILVSSGKSIYVYIYM